MGSPGTHFSLQRDAWMQTCSRAGLLLQSKCFHYRKSAVFACVCIDAICHEELLLVRADGRWCWSSWRLRSGCVLLYLVHKQVATGTYILRQIQGEDLNQGQRKSRLIKKGMFVLVTDPTKRPKQSQLQSIFVPTEVHVTAILANLNRDKSCHFVRYLTFTAAGQTENVL